MAGLHAASALALLGAMAGCFTHPINRAPMVAQPMPTTTDPIIRGQDVTFMVEVSDPDQDHVDITWAVKPDACPDRNQPSNWPKDAKPTTDPSPFTFTVSGDQTDTRFCVWVLATDAHGARTANNRIFDPSNPANQPPTAHINLIDPTVSTTYPLYTKFKLVASGEDPDGDRDPITAYTWSPLQVPPSSDAMLGPCDDGASDETVKCFTANTPGEYTASLNVSSRAPFATADDVSKMPDVKTYTVLEDAPPCIGLTMPIKTTIPIQRDPGQAWTFSVDTIEDDGDPFPKGSKQDQFPIITWSFGLKGDPLTVVDGNSNQFTIQKDRFNELDVSVIRVEVLDRRDKTLTGLQMCDKDACEANPGSGCYQRVTWTVLWK